MATGRKNAERLTKRPDFSPCFELFAGNGNLGSTFGLSNGMKLGDVFWAAIAETDGPGIAYLTKLNLELAAIPLGLSGVVVSMNHREQHTPSPGQSPRG